MDFQEIEERSRRIIAEPVYPISDDILEKERARYYATHERSWKLFERAQKVIPGGIEHNLSLEKPFPLTMKSGDGYQLTDVDDRTYVDYLMAGAPIILGHHYRPLDDRVAALIRESGPGVGASSEWEVLAAETICRLIPSADMVRFLQSGTEAVMAALRLARIYTNKKKIIKIGGSYHGWSDQMVYSLHVPGTGPLEAAGIPPEMFSHILDVAPNDFEALGRAFATGQDNGGVAAVIVEPIGGESGEHPVHPEWNTQIRELCDRHGALLIFDEVVTGFRLSLGGAQQYLGITPDLTVLGKIVAHGYPSAGAVAGKRAVMEGAAGAGNIGMKAYLGGTLAANPISTAAGYWALHFMEEENAVERASHFAERLTAELNKLFATRPDLPFFAYNFGSIIHYQTSGLLSVRLTDPDPLRQVMVRRKVAQDYQMVAINRGLYTLAGTRMYTSMQHDQHALQKTLDIWQELLDLIPKSLNG